MRSPGLLRIVVAASAALSACTSVAGLTTAEDPDAGLPDRSQDASSELPVSVTSSTDASTDEAAAATYCTTLTGTHGFCDDFDDGVFGAKWSAKNQLGGTLSAIDGGVSAPFALGALAEVTPTKLALEKEWTDPVKSITCELDMRVAQFGLVTATLVQFELASTQVASHRISYLLQTAKGTLDEQVEYAGGGYVGNGTDVPLPAVGQWHHLRFVVIVRKDGAGGAEPSATLTSDGKQQAALALNDAFADPVKRTRFSIGLTNGLGGATNEWKVHYDNVVCDLK